MLTTKQTENSRVATFKNIILSKIRRLYKQVITSTTSFEYHVGKLLSSRTFGNNNKQVLE